MAEPQPEKRRRRKKTEEAEIAAEAADAKQETAEADAPVEGAPDEGTPDEDATPEEQPKGRRRAAAETTTPKPKPKVVPAPRNDAGQVEVRARARYVRSAPRKARLVMHHIRGKRVADARAILGHTPRAASTDVLKLLNSAVANAESNHELAADELRVVRAFVDEGPTIKRYRPRALGRATRINKRTSHMTIELTTAERGRR